MGGIKTGDKHVTPFRSKTLDDPTATHYSLAAMKTRIPLTALAALVASSSLYAQTPAYSKPSGYTTQTLGASLFHVVGFNLQSSALATGVLTGVSGADLTDGNVNFSTLLPAGKMCVIEIISGTADTAVQDFAIWSGSTITLPAAISGVAIGDKYTVRKVPTLQETFTNPTISSALSATASDIIWVPTGTGSYTKYWKKNDGTWRLTTTGANDAGTVTTDVPLLYIDAVLLQKKSTSSTFVLTGEVKKTGSRNTVAQGFNPVSVVAPTGLTLLTAGLNPASALSATGSDIIWVPTGTGSYTKYWRKNDGTWRLTTTGTNDAGLVVGDPVLPSGFLYQRKSGGLLLNQIVPASYSNL